MDFPFAQFPFLVQSHLSLSVRYTGAKVEILALIFYEDRNQWLFR